MPPCCSPTSSTAPRRPSGWVTSVPLHCGPSTTAGHATCFARHRGREIGRTDGLLMLFDIGRRRRALRAELPRRNGRHRARSARRDACRSGRAARNLRRRRCAGGQANEADGLALPFASRLMAMARGGQTLLTAAAKAALDPAGLGTAVEIRSHGHYRLKGIDEPVAVFEIGRTAHCSFVPPSDNDKSYRVVRRGELWQPVRDILHFLPAEPDSFVGAPADLATIARHFSEGARLLTLLGPGGTGKTRLAIRYGHGALGEWPGGIWFCDLSDASSLEGIHYATASALGVRLGSWRCRSAADRDDRGARPLPGHPRQLRAGRAARGCHHRPLAGRARRGVHGHEPGATPRRRRGRAGRRALAFRRSRDRSFRRARAGGEARLRAGRRAAKHHRRNRQAPRRSAARHRAGGRAHRRACPVAAPGAPARPLQVAGGPQRREPPSDAACRHRLVVAAARPRGSRRRSSSARCSKAGFTLAAAEGVVDLSSWPDAPPTIDVDAGPGRQESAAAVGSRQRAATP